MVWSGRGGGGGGWRMQRVVWPVGWGAAVGDHGSLGHREGRDLTEAFKLVESYETCKRIQHTMDWVGWIFVHWTHIGEVGLGICKQELTETGFVRIHGHLRDTRFYNTARMRIGE